MLSGLHNRRWCWAALGAVVVLGSSLAWWLRDPGSARVVIRPPRWSGPLGFTLDGRTFRTVDEHGVKRWDVATGRAVGQAPLPAVWQSPWASFGPSCAGRVDGADGPAVVWVDSATDAVRARFPVPGRDLWCPILVNGGRTIRAVLIDQTGIREVATWDLATGAEVRRVLTGPQQPGWRFLMTISFNGRTCVYHDGNRRGILLWDTEADRQIGPILANPGVGGACMTSAGFSQDGRTLAVGRDNGRVECWDVAAARLLWTAAPHPVDSDPNEIEFSPDGRTLASGAYDPGMGWRGRARRQFNARVPPSWAIPRRREVVLLDVPTGAVVARLSGSIHPMFSPDGRTLATEGQDGSFSLRNVPQP